MHRRAPVTDSCITVANGLKLMQLFLQQAELLLQQLSVFLFQTVPVFNKTVAVDLEDGYYVDVALNPTADELKCSLFLLTIIVRAKYKILHFHQSS